MAFCGKCGLKATDGDNFCRGCGATLASKGKAETAARAAKEATREAASKVADATRETASKVADVTRETASKVADATRETASKVADAARKAWNESTVASDEDISKNKGLAILSYIPFLNFIPFFVEKESAYVRFHAVQGMYLFLLFIASSVACNIFRAIRWGMHGFWWVFGGGWLFLLLEFALGIMVLALIICGIVYAASGRSKELPIVGYMLKFGWFK